MNYTNANTNFTRLNANIDTYKTEKFSGIKKAIVEIANELASIEEKLSNKKAMKLVKTRILGLDKNVEITTELNNSYKVAFTLLFRGIQVHVDAFNSMSQIIDFVTRVNVATINDLHERVNNGLLSFPEYEIKVAKEIKALKTRKTTVMTFEKK